MNKADFSREELFALVWSKPTTELVTELGISDVAIAKLCARLKVPKPPRGYWAKVAAGQRPRQTPLDAFRARKSNRLKTKPTSPRTDLSPIQRKFVEQALSELIAEGVDLGLAHIKANQLRDIGPEAASQILLRIQNSYHTWIKQELIDVPRNQGVRRSLSSLVEKLLPLAKPQVIIFKTARESSYASHQEPLLLLRLTADLQMRIAQLARIVREQRLEHVVMALGSGDHAWSAHHVYSSDSYADAKTVLCVSADAMWAQCTIFVYRLHGEQAETSLTQKLSLRSLMPIEHLSGRDIELPPSPGRAKVRQHRERLRALVEAERVHEMLDRSLWDMKDSIPDHRLIALERIWTGGDQTLIGARRSWERMAAELEHWAEQLEAERSALCCEMLGIQIGDNIVYPHRGETTRLCVTRTSIMINDERSILVIEGLRFRKDGTPGKRSEHIWIDLVAKHEA